MLGNVINQTTNPNFTNDRWDSMHNTCSLGPSRDDLNTSKYHSWWFMAEAISKSSTIWPEMGGTTYGISKKTIYIYIYKLYQNIWVDITDMGGLIIAVPTRLAFSHDLDSLKRLRGRGAGWAPRCAAASTSVTSGHSNGVGRSEQWGYPYIPLGHTRWCPRSYKLVYNPHKNYRYNPHKP